MHPLTLLVSLYAPTQRDHELDVMTQSWLLYYPSTHVHRGTTEGYLQYNSGGNTNLANLISYPPLVPFILVFLNYNILKQPYLSCEFYTRNEITLYGPSGRTPGEGAPSLYVFISTDFIKIALYKRDNYLIPPLQTKSPSMDPLGVRQERVYCYSLWLFAPRLY